MRTGTMIEQTARLAGLDGGMPFLSPDGFAPAPGHGTPANADERWRPAPDPATGALRVDPEFSLPTSAGPLSWRLFFDAQNDHGPRNEDYGVAWRGSFPLRIFLTPNGDEAVVSTEEGVRRVFHGQMGPPGTWVLLGRPTGDTLVTNVDDSWLFTRGDNGYQYHFPAGGYVSALYRATPQGERITYNYSGSGQLSSVQ